MNLSYSDSATRGGPAAAGSVQRAPGKLHEGWNQGKGRLIPGCEIRSHTQALIRPRPSLNSLIPACCFGVFRPCPGECRDPGMSAGIFFPALPEHEDRLSQIIIHKVTTITGYYFKIFDN